MKSFEKALSLACKEYVFLADQDDEWLPRKMEKMMNAFSEGADLVIHNATVVDGYGNIIENKRYKKKLGGNIITRHFINNHNMGCLMAFRTKYKEMILPIPDITESHDQWIGLLIDLVGGKMVFIDENLINWVRHGNNTSFGKRRNILLVIKSRIVMFILLMKAIIRKNEKK